MTSSQVRNAFLEFFREKGHVIVPSSPLVPHGDPTLLLTNAGMVQMKPYFMGEFEPPGKRLTSAQKCFRTTDIDSVGNERSLTFFEMLGNFSVGDYFKEGAISFAWELVTQRFAFAPERIWVSIYPEDDEAFELWRKIAGIPEQRLVRLEDNWWGPAGESGPCGPDSELYWDRGPEFGCGKPSCMPGCDCARFLEFWNLVFMQYYQDENKVRTPLPKKHIDTGLGLERAAMLLQGGQSVYDTDLFSPIIRREEDLTGSRYGTNPNRDFSLRVIADHSRAMTFLIADGVLPSNEGRGYILRRVIRRAVRHGKLLGQERPFLNETVKVVVSAMKEAYPELAQREDFIYRVVSLEEARFNQTLSVGLGVLDTLVGDVVAKGEATIPGELVFRLYDTYGFPKELTQEVAAEHGLTIDQAGFEDAMRRQRERARAAAKFGLAPRERQAVYEQLPVQETTFVGHDKLDVDTYVVGLVAEGRVVEKVGEGQEVDIVLQQTPFYPEGGGQVGDAGIITGEAGRARVVDTQRPLPATILHQARVEEGYLEVGHLVHARVDAERRLDTARHHTATHLLHKALRDVLGSHAQQSGSLVAPDRLRFDFAHLGPMSKEELARVEGIVQEKVREDMSVKESHIRFAEAKAADVVALFGEKYGEIVRMISIDQYSRELCGGTHLSRTGQIGTFLIVGESGIGAGLRRIEALAGRAADELVRSQRDLLDRLAQRLQSTNVEERVEALLADTQELKREVDRLYRSLAGREIEVLLARAREVDGTKVLSAEVRASSMDMLREMGDSLRARLGRSVIVLGAIIGERPSFVVMAAPETNVHAGQLAKRVASVVGGSGGGRPDVAQGGGKDATKMQDALQIVWPFVEQSHKGRD
ncbi:MAG: alanine--tRNA ligase [Chloroflexi bacterium]|nr:alanine--tRNA ligase [Chloroflexota bacterium]